MLHVVIALVVGLIVGAVVTYAFRNKAQAIITAEERRILEYFHAGQVTLSSVAKAAEKKL